MIIFLELQLTRQLQHKDPSNDAVYALKIIFCISPLLQTRIFEHRTRRDKHKSYIFLSENLRPPSWRIKLKSLGKNNFSFPCFHSWMMETHVILGKIAIIH